MEDAGASALKARLGLRQFVGRSERLSRIVARIPRVATSDAPVILFGETGTGKELCAHAIHYLSPRSGRPFVPVNCGALPAEIADNELFGHVAGAYTHAERAQSGLIHAASGGTLFLDEVDALPLPVQVKLLRFLQDQHYRALGSPEILRADVRILSATNISPNHALESGRLRRDLYYRLNTVSLELPPLRDRKEDVPDLAVYFIARHAPLERREGVVLTDRAMMSLVAYEWPGNVRELEQVIRRALILSEGGVIDVEQLELPESRGSGFESFKDAKARVVNSFERSYLERVLRMAHGNITRAAQLAKKNRRAFFELLRKHQFDLESFRGADP